jgi:hypothetical protein
MSKVISLTDRVNLLRSREDFVAFLNALLTDFETDPGSWENDDLERYFGAMAAWVADMDGYYLNRAESIPENVTWKVLGQILLAAKYYE